MRFGNDFRQFLSWPSLASVARCGGARQVLLSLGLICLGASAFGQMEKRRESLYDAAQFLVAAPAVGTMSPDVELLDLEGNKVPLSDFRGKTLVLIKGGYT